MKNAKKPIKTIGEIRIYRQNKMYLYIKIPKELEDYFKEHLPVRQSTVWKLKNGEFASFYCFVPDNAVDNDFAHAVQEGEEAKKNFTEAESKDVEESLDSAMKFRITQHYLDNNYGSTRLYIAGSDTYNIAPLRTVGASKGITLEVDGLLPPDSATEYVSILGQVVKSFYAMLVARTDIRAKITLDINL